MVISWKIFFIQTRSVYFGEPVVTKLWLFIGTKLMILKAEKELIKVLLYVIMAEEKLRPLVVGKYKNSRYFVS